MTPVVPYVEDETSDVPVPTNVVSVGEQASSQIACKVKSASLAGS